MHSLIDEKGYNAQINCELTLKNGNTLLAGEDGLIKIILKNKNDQVVENNKEEKVLEFYLEKMLDSDGYLANIEDCKESGSGNIVCVETLGSVGVYEKEKDYKLKIIPSKIINDCFYYLNIIENSEVEVWGERKIKYKINI